MSSNHPQAAKSVRRKYNFLAIIYDILYRNYLDKTTAAAADALPLNGSLHLLDIGCGTGSLEKKLFQKNANLNIVGVDLSAEMLGRARKKFAEGSNTPDIQWLEGDFLSINLPSESFDVAYALSNFHYFPNPKAVLEKSRHLLKRGGRFILVDWNRSTFKGRFYQRYMKTFDPAFVKVYTPEEATQLFSSAGFQVETTHRFKVGFLWQMMLLVAKKN